VSAATPQQALAANGDRVSVPMTAARDCLWSASVDAPWLQVSPATGQGDGAVTVTASPNPSSNPRIGTVSINGTSVAVFQAGTTPAATPPPTTSTPPESIPPVSTSPGGSTPDPTTPPDETPIPTPQPPVTPAPPSALTCSPFVTPTTVTVDSKGGEGQIIVTVSSGCSWSAVSNAGWITLTSGRTGNGNGEVSYSIQEQHGKGSRSTTLSVAGVSVPVTQSGRKD
jgi:hypothetical protein